MTIAHVDGLVEAKRTLSDDLLASTTTHATPLHEDTPRSIEQVRTGTVYRGPIEVPLLTIEARATRSEARRQPTLPHRHTDSHVTCSIADF